MIFDYDGTLAMFESMPQLAAPTTLIKTCLTSLTEDPRNTVVVVSDRSKKVVQDWFGFFKGSSRVILAAESGLFMSTSGARGVGVGVGVGVGGGGGGLDTDVWERRLMPGTEMGVGVVDDKWRDVVTPVLQYFTDRTPGSFIERKDASLMWHYMDADVNFGAWQAKDMQLQLEELLVSYPLEVARLRKCVEVRPLGAGKGHLTTHILDKLVSRRCVCVCVCVCVCAKPRMSRCVAGTDRRSPFIYLVLIVHHVLYTFLIFMMPF